MPKKSRPQYANKHSGYLRGIVSAFYEDLEIDDYTNPFETTRIKGEAIWEKSKKPSPKLEFTPSWISKTSSTELNWTD
ncbi:MULTISPECIES: hypothetical protein [Roseobacteraceae]|uniref:hypothetical protein n=1 Tax=Roseobacteraceae TaxID=2854170 RepID=UPI0015F0C33A|nr:MULTISPECIES: hypothetical protein [Roseobacteraceae]